MHSCKDIKYSMEMSMLIALLQLTITTRASYRTLAMNVNHDVKILFSGLPGSMAMETAKVCLSGGLNVLPFAFTGHHTNNKSVAFVGSDGTSFSIELIKGLSVSPDAVKMLHSIKANHPNLLVIDYTSPASALGNLRAYIAAECDFVMGTTGLEPGFEREFENANSYALIAPNMAKQIVALQAALQQMSAKFPGAFDGYDLSVEESHQTSKRDISGTAKAMLPYISKLNNNEFDPEQIIAHRERQSQLAFGVPEGSLEGHAFHTYTFFNKEASFQLKHNVCGRRIYAEGTVDAVRFLDGVRRRSPRPTKRVYNMMDVLLAGSD